MLIVCALIILGVVALDQATKWVVMLNMELGESLPLIKDVFHFTYIRNEGAAFGILSSHRWIFMTLSIVAIIAIGVYLFKFCKESFFTKIGLALIIGGGIGNMIDRIFLKYVVDMIDCRFIDFYIFNFADCCVCVGAGIVVLGFILSMIKEYKEKAIKDGAAGTDDENTGI